MILSDQPTSQTLQINLSRALAVVGMLGVASSLMITTFLTPDVGALPHDDQTVAATAEIVQVEPTPTPAKTAH
jgi:hypothetical protein